VGDGLKVETAKANKNFMLYTY